MKKHAFTKVLTLGAAGLLTLTTANAVTVVTENENDDNTAGSTGDASFPAFWSNNFTTTNDVLAGLTPTSATGNFSAEGNSSATAYTDGVLTPVPTSGTDLSLFSTVGGTGGTQLQFALALPTRLSAIQYYGGWLDQGRSDALFNVSYSIDGGLTYTRLVDPTGGTFSVEADPRQNLPVTGTDGNVPGSTFSKYIGGAAHQPVTNFVNITDNGGDLVGGALITNLQFDFLGGRNGYDGLAELTAYSDVPEPGTWVYSGLGAAVLGLSFLRRRSA